MGDAVIVNMGCKKDGILRSDEVAMEEGQTLADLFKVGDEIDVFVIQVKDSEGIARLSKKRVDADNSWVVLKEAYDNGEILEGKVTSVIKGGVLVSTKANTVFVPASQTGLAKGADLSALRGTVQKARIIEVDKFKKRAIASIRSVQREERKAAEELAAKLSNITVRINAASGADGRLYGAVTAKEIAQEVERACGFSIDKRKISLDNPIKAYGTYKISVRLFEDVSGIFTVVVEG
jgi:ribosomal protein L9